ncbi:M56 family metallopeptidase [Streptococcus gordonii]|uniref:M56 family metallopeptidase n=1 Tax=Streptococcus gordonii TaxID=1302 RepID=UPI001D05F8B7|nr:M56 family metallopeptidase [Streptococcus gordonii]MCB6583972.1 M56 family metallopeptidase [Streptococcus gordonii]MCB7052768.1 M56 family metallopeptidase [Streptococcus gordonii]MCB7055144.1 M56 family metallopeptidase [Streptococcus gordonii]MCG4841292.1 M56 family metallopeptidase [Streptococcus gordonii]
MKQFLLSFLLTSVSTSILVILLSLLFALFKTRVSARAKYVIWFLVLLSFLFPFRPQFGSGLIRMNAGSTINTVATQVPSGTAQVASQVTEKTIQPNLWQSFLNLPWFEILIAIWLLGFVFSIARYAYSYILFRKMLKRWGTPVEDEEALAQLQKIQEEMGIKNKVRLLHYPMSQSPMLIGFRDILIVLPESDYTEEELQLVFRHELTHYKHYDVLINLLAILVKSLHWFNPIVRLACRETQEVGEMYCDYDVLNDQDMHYRTFYGETILTMIDRSKKTPIALTTCFYSEKFNLKRRIVSIMDSRLPKKLLSTVFVVAVSVLLLLTSSVFAIETSAINVQKTQKVINKKVSKEFSQDQALAVALKDLGLGEKDIKNLKIVRDKDNYQIYFSHGQTAHELLINAKNGKVLKSKQHTVVEKTVTVEKEVPSSNHTSTDTNQPAVTTHSSSPSVTTVPSPSKSQTSSSRDDDDKDADDDKDDDDD